MKTETQITVATACAIGVLWIAHGLAMTNIIGNGAVFQVVTLFTALIGTAACLGSHVALCHAFRNRKPDA